MPPLCPCHATAPPLHAALQKPATSPAPTRLMAGGRGAVTASTCPASSSAMLTGGYHQYSQDFPRRQAGSAMHLALLSRIQQPLSSRDCSERKEAGICAADADAWPSSPGTCRFLQDREVGWEIYAIPPPNNSVLWVSYIHGTYYQVLVTQRAVQGLVAAREGLLCGMHPCLSAPPDFCDGVSALPCSPWTSGNFPLMRLSS